MREVVVAELGDLAEVLVARCEEVALAALATRGRVALALTGGNTMRVLAPALVQARLPWEHLEVFWGDERAVPPTDPESNYRLAHDVLLSRVPLVPSHVHRMPGDQPDLEAAAAAYEDELRSALGPVPRLDLVLLGMGPDGHVCSLFPGHAALFERTRLVLAITDSPKPPPVRFTLTLPMLWSAGLVVVAALGSEKAEAVRRVLDADDEGLPVTRVTRHAASVLFLLDPEAAGTPHPEHSSG